MRSPFDTHRAGSGFLHGSRFARGILNPHTKRTARPETEAAADTPGSTANGKAGPDLADTPGQTEASSGKSEASPDETTDHYFA